MSTSTLLYAQSVMDVFRVLPGKSAIVPPESVALPAPPARHDGAPTMFQRCLAVHMYAAERASALD
jgi:hypothetical protein